jgi:hypothetical protein
VVQCIFIIAKRARTYVICMYIYIYYYIYNIIYI